MPLDNQLQRGLDYIDKTKMATAAAMRKIWPCPQDCFSKREVTQLLYEALGARLNAILTSYQRREFLRQAVTISQPDAQKAATVRVVPVKSHVEQAEVRVVSVVRILQETKYYVNSSRKAVADFEVDDCIFMISQSRAAIQGHERHLTVFEYTRQQLEETGVKQVSSLPGDEQGRIAKMLARAKRGDEPFGPEPTEPPPGVPPKFGPVSSNGAPLAEQGVA